MKSQTEMLVTAVVLVQDDEFDGGLVRVTAQGVDEALQRVEFLANISDGWCVGHRVGALIYWNSENPEDDDTEHVVDRAFAADRLDPSDFTDESVDSARITEIGLGGGGDNGR